MSPWFPTVMVVFWAVLWLVCSAEFWLRKKGRVDGDPWVPLSGIFVSTLALMVLALEATR